MKLDPPRYPTRMRVDYQELWNAAPLMHVLLDAWGFVVDINAAGCDWLRCEDRLVVGLPLLSWIATPDRRRFLDHLRESRSTDAAVDTSLSLAARDGGVMPVRLLSQRQVVGRYVLLPTIVLDETEQQVLERARDSAEWAREAAERQRQMAQEREEAKHRILAIVSHELRNPLNPALMAAQSLAAMQDLGDEARHLAGIVMRNIQVEARLIDDLLDVARIGRGRLELQQQRIDLHGVLQDAIDACAPLLADRRVAVERCLGARRVQVNADASRLRQVFWNLMANGIKFSDPGGRVRVTTEDGSGRIRVRVQDSGAGMDPDALAQVFLPFEERAALGERGGLGLGLAISKGIADAHGGALRASSEGRGRGSTFELELPLAESATHGGETAAPAPPPAAPAAGSRPQAGYRLRVLIVEDHADTGEMLKLFLAHRKHDVVLARSLADGLSQLAAGWDVVVSDLALRDGSGLEIARRARTLPRRPGVLVALTGFGAEDQEAASRLAGFDDHLVKPIDLDALCALLERPARDSA